MGNYSDQPDYATSASNHTPDTVNFTTFLDQSAIYVSEDSEVSVIMAGNALSYANAVHFKNLKEGMFLPVVVDYIVNYPAIIANGTIFNTGGTIAGAATGDYTFTADVKVNGTDVDGSVKIRMVMDGTTITTFEAVNDSTNSADLVGGTSVFTIPANAIGSNAATNITIAAIKVSPSKNTSVADIVTYK